MSAVQYDVFKRQIYDLIRLQSWYLWHLVHAQNRDYTDILGKPAVLDFWYWPQFRPENLVEQWEETKQLVFQKCRQYPPDADTAALEDDLLDLITLFVDDAYLQRMYEHYLKTFNDAAPFAGFTFGCRDAPEQRIDLHFTNCDVPDSPFKNKQRLFAGLRHAVNTACAQRPDIGWISCGSWLNDLPLFRELFPPSWTDNPIPAPIAAHGGWWQQFIDRTGAMHKRNEMHLRTTGEFPFQCSRCGCAATELKAYLKEAGNGDNDY